MITSRFSSEGKSYVTMNLMRTLASMGRKVVVVDTDLRASGIQAAYGLRYAGDQRKGLSEYLAGHCSAEQVVYHTDIPNAWIIPAGHTAPNPLQLLDTEKMKQLIDSLAEQFDIVLLDTPPIGILVDAIAMAKFCDGAALVVGYHQGKLSEIGDAVRSIRQTGCPVLGAVLNEVKLKSMSNRHYYYHSRKYSGYGKIEIHTNLYPELTQRAWKDFVASKDLQSEPWIRVYEPDGSFNTLGHTDQLIFLTLHMVKHFVESGLSIRMMLDTALHFSRFYQEIDVQRFWCVMRSLRCDGCVSVILWIMIRCGGFRAEDFPGIVEAAPESMDGILRDLETGGYMGAKAMQERHESGMEYYRRMLMKNKSTLQYWCYMLSWKVRSGSSNMFPSYQRLKAMYPCIEYNPCIAPAVWMFQMVLYPVSKIRTGVLRRDIRSERSVISSESEQRVALFEKLGMF